MKIDADVVVEAVETALWNWAEKLEHHHLRQRKEVNSKLKTMEDKCEQMFGHCMCE